MVGDSACLMQQPFCYASGISNEPNESNPVHALGQSISFGRFMSESLAWEKWSTFSHNRYVEEAEKYSRPGSVAQKKAFFEAHYKKLAAQKAAAMLEQANNAAAQNNATEQKDTSVIDNEVVVKGEQEDGSAIDNDTHNSQKSPHHEVILKGEQDAKVLSLTSESDLMVRATSHDSDSNAEASVATESNKVEEAETEMEQAALEDVDAHKEQNEKICVITPPVMTPTVKVELQNQLEDVDAHKEQNEKISVITPPVMTPTVKQVLDSNSDQEVLAYTGKKKKPPVSFSELLRANGTSMFNSTPVKFTAPNGTSKFNSTPVKSTAPNGTSKFNSTPVKSTAPIFSSKRDNIATPMSNKPAALRTADKKRTTPKSLQTSAHFTPMREFNRLTASVMRKFESARASAGSSRASKESLMTPLKTPTMASKEMEKHSSLLTPLTEKKRNKTPIDPSVAGNHTSGPKWRLLSGERNKLRSPVISSPFNLRTEERASRRKKKLEEKFNANEPQKVQLHTKLKEKAGTEIRKLSQSFCFKAPLPDFYREMTAPKNETTKNPLTQSESHKEGRKPNHSMAESKTTLPPNRPSLKSNSTKNFQGKSGRALTHHPLTSSSMMNITTHENTTPNIQHGNQNDRNYR